MFVLLVDIEAKHADNHTVLRSRWLVEKLLIMELKTKLLIEFGTTKIAIGGNANTVVIKILLVKLVQRKHVSWIEMLNGVTFMRMKLWFLLKKGKMG